MENQRTPFINKFRKFGLVIGAVLIGLFLMFFVITNLLDEAGIKITGLTAPSSLSFGGNPLGMPNFSGIQPYSIDSRIATKSEENQLTIISGVAVDRKVIRNGSLDLLVKSAEATAKDIRGVAEKLGGFVAGVDIYNVAQDAKSGAIVIRVPADKFNAALEEIKKFAVKVERENSNAQDVTEQYIDLESRLKNFRAQEAQYLEIMKRAYTIEDILSVTSRLSEVRGQVEQIEGQLKYLANQIDLASISVSLIEEGDVEVFGISWRPLYVAKQALRNLISGLAGYVDSMIKFIFQVPIILLWLATIGLILLAVWKILRWSWGKFNNY